jgi:hypothetical protein
MVYELTKLLRQDAPHIICHGAVSNRFASTTTNYDVTKTVDFVV